MKDYLYYYNHRKKQSIKIPQLILLILLCLNLQGLFAQSAGSGPFELNVPADATNIVWFKDGTAITPAVTDTVYMASTEGTYWATYEDASSGCTGLSSDFYSVVQKAPTVNTILDAPSGNNNYQWYKDAQPDATSEDLVLPNSASSVGTYHVTYNNGSCDIEYGNILFYLLQVCDVDTIAPIFSAPVVGNICPTPSVDLTGIVAQQAPTCNGIRKLR